MDYLELLDRFVPENEEEAQTKRLFLDTCRSFSKTILTRENELVHLTVSGFIMDPTLEQMLMVHHNIYKSWSWSGGHCDGDDDLLGVALREAREETGLVRVEPQTGDPVSLDILPVPGHWRRGRYVCPHLHLSAAFVLIAQTDQPLQKKPDENSGVRWFDARQLPQICAEVQMIPVYAGIVRRARRCGGVNPIDIF